jgi:heat shock protein HtpX
LYEEITANKWKSFSMVFIFIAFVLGVGYLLGRIWGGWYYGIAIAGVIATVMALVSYYQSDSVALRLSGARPVVEGEYVRYRNAVEGLALAAGIPTPKIYVIDSQAMNAFATGRNPEHASVCATTGLLDGMDEQELEGVIGHEVSHVRNYDILLMTVTIVLVGTLILLSDIFLRTFWFGGEREEGGGGEATLILLIIGIALAILAPIIGQLIKLAISRRREYLADANGALLTRYPLGLASALEKLQQDDYQLRTANKATAHLFIVQPLKTEKGQRGSWFNRMFDTHPPIEERIARLKHMSGDFVPVEAPQPQQ